MAYVEYPPEGAIANIDPAVLDALVTTKVAAATAPITSQLGQKMDITVYDVDNNGLVDANKQQSYTHPQAIVSDTWTINHNLNRYPPVLVRNNAGEPVTPNEVQYPTANTTIITFGVPMSGTAEFI